MEESEVNIKDVSYEALMKKLATKSEKEQQEFYLLLLESRPAKKASLSSGG